MMAWHCSSSRRERGAARSKWDSRTWCVLGSWNERPSRNWVWRRLDDWGAGRPRRKEREWGERQSLAITAIFGLESTYVFRLSVSIRKDVREYPFCVRIYMNSCIFHICFNLCIFLSNTYLIFNSLYAYLWPMFKEWPKHTHMHTKIHTQKRKTKKVGGKKGKNREHGKEGRKEKRSDKIEEKEKER